MMKFQNEIGLVNYVSKVFEISVKMITLLSKEKLNSAVQPNSSPGLQKDGQNPNPNDDSQLGSLLSDPQMVNDSPFGGLSY